MLLKDTQQASIRHKAKTSSALDYIQDRKLAHKLEPDSSGWWEVTTEDFHQLPLLCWPRVGMSRLLLKASIF